MLTKGKFLVSFEVPGHTKDYTEGFTEEMVIPYRTEELNPYLRYPNQEINKNHLHSEFIRLRLREILQINLSDITIIDIIPLPWILHTQGNPIPNHHPNPHTQWEHLPTPPNKQNKVPNITNPNPNNIYHPNDPNTKVPITNTPSQTKTKREIIKNLYTKGIHNTYIPNQYNHILYLI